MPKGFDVSLKVVMPKGNPYQGEYVLNLRDCSGLDDLDVRNATGFTLVGLFQEQNRDIGMAAVTAAVVVWLVRRKQFAHTTFEDVASTVTWGSDFELGDPDKVFAEDDDAGKVEVSETLLAVSDTSQSSQPVTE
jgi:hypothetical protein